jgi:hypothetical protein
LLPFGTDQNYARIKKPHALCVLTDLG